jgi:hypothetical protein
VKEIVIMQQLQQKLFKKPAVRQEI